MEETPRTRYAQTDDGYNIAYQVFGSGPIDLLQSVALWWHLEFMWTDPHTRKFMERLSRIARVILFDKRGTGLSDRVPTDRLPTLDERVDDITAVLDAVGSERVVVWGVNHGVPLAVLFTATHPNRVERLILLNGTARITRTDGYPHGISAEDAEKALRAIGRRWDEPHALNYVAPSFVDDEAAREWWARMQRLSVSPSGAAALWQMALETDVRAVLPAIRVPTLVMHHAGDRLFGIAAGRYLAEHIPAAKFVELAGSDQIFVDASDISNEIEAFLTGQVVPAEPERVLAAVLFTDIVDSTGQLVRMGDRRWRDTLQRHNDLVDRTLQRFRGRRVSSAGDGVFAVFDRPGRAVTCALTIRDGLSALGLQIRAGVHVGEVEVRQDDVAGVAVHVGARMAALADPGEVFVSQTVTDLVAGSGIAFESVGTRELKGLPGRRELFRVVP